MNRLESRVEKLEKALSATDEVIISIVRFVTPKGQELSEEQKREYLPVEEQIAAGRAEGKKVILVFKHSTFEQSQ